MKPMDIDTVLKIAPYALTQQEKEGILVPLFNDLIQHHVSHSPGYARIIDLLYQGVTHYASIESLPYLPVNVFKEMRLASIPDDQIL